LKILDANFKMELTSTSNNVFTRLFDGALHKRVGLGKSLQTFDELRQVSRVLRLNGHTHDR